MKSIKEKAEELAPYTRENSWSKIQKCIIAQTSFEAGANYVIEILEKELPLEDNKNLNDYGKALVWRLKECIEQLKK